MRAWVRVRVRVRGRCVRFFVLSRLRGAWARRRKGGRGRGVGLGLFLIVGFSGGFCLLLLHVKFEAFASHENDCRRIG